MNGALTSTGVAGGRPRDVMVRGMGFCLPGITRPIFTVGDLWDVAGNGRSCLSQDDIYHGSVDLSAGEFDERLPDFPGVFAQHFTAAHRFGLVSLIEACADAGLEPRSGDLTAAAILVGRGGIDSNVGSYQAVLRADPETITPQGALDLFIAGEQGITPSDVVLVQTAFTRSTAPCFTVSCGCASSAVQLGIARSMIAGGEVDMAVVTGVDVFSADIVRKTQRFLHVAQRALADSGPAGMLELPKSFDRVMRPYDRRAECVNFGEGSVTLILESRAHADQRDARQYGQILANAMTRDGLAHPLASDGRGYALVAAVRKCLRDRWDISQIPYVHGASDGDAVVTAFEVDAITQLYGSAAADLLMTSQEACFGHSGAPAGTLGVALTLLMLERQEICPTTNCEEPADNIVFDPVPGIRTRRLDFDYALNFTYQIGGVKNVILLGAPTAA
jgi:3-oxoacyl-[acyl-carrier-protein] synthase II